MNERASDSKPPVGDIAVGTDEHVLGIACDRGSASWAKRQMWCDGCTMSVSIHTNVGTGAYSEHERQDRVLEADAMDHVSALHKVRYRRERDT